MIETVTGVTEVSKVSEVVVEGEGEVAEEASLGSPSVSHGGI